MVWITCDKHIWSRYSPVCLWVPFLYLCEAVSFERPKANMAWERIHYACMMLYRGRDALFKDKFGVVSDKLSVWLCIRTEHGWVKPPCCWMAWVRRCIESDDWGHISKDSQRQEICFFCCCCWDFPQLRTESLRLMLVVWLTKLVEAGEEEVRFCSTRRTVKLTNIY